MCYNFKDSSWCLQMSKYISAHPAAVCRFLSASWPRSEKIPEHCPSCNSMRFLFSAGGVFHGHCLPSSLLHGSLFVDAGRRASPVEQSGSSQHEWRQENEVLLFDRLGYLQLPLHWELKTKNVSIFFFSKSFAWRDSPDSDAESDKCLVWFSSQEPLFCRGFFTLLCQIASLTVQVKK